MNNLSYIAVLTHLISKITQKRAARKRTALRNANITYPNSFQEF